MTPIDYLCKICRKPGVAYYDPDCPIANLNAWQSCICCDRCYKFHDVYRTTKRNIERLCTILIVSQAMSNDAVRKDAANKIRERLIVLTKRLASVCSEYYLVQNVWDMEMVQVLMNKPDGCNKSVNAFRSGYERLSIKEENLLAV